MRYEVGNLITSGPYIIAHGCNAQGVMGSGVAKQIRDEYPKVYEAYKTFCNSYETKDIMGACYQTSELNRIILNLITQENYGRVGQRYVSYDAIDLSLRQIPFTHKEIGIPKIGAGLGGGNWNVIEAIIKEVEKDTNNEFVVYVL